MGYLITQIIICLFIAAVIGFIMGWLIRGLNSNNKQQIYHGVRPDSVAVISDSNTISQAEAETDNIFIEPITKAPVKSHQIERIQGIDKSIRKVLHKIGVKTTLDLIDQCASETGFQQVLSSTTVTDNVVKQWLSMADLMRVPGIDGHYAELVEAAGIKSVQFLTQSDAEALTLNMQRLNQTKQMLPGNLPVPDDNMVIHWIKDAKTLPVKNL